MLPAGFVVVVVVVVVVLTLCSEHVEGKLDYVMMFNNTLNVLNAFSTYEVVNF